MIIGEGRVRADEHVVLEPQAVPELDSALDRDPIAQHYVIFDEGVVADVAVAAQDRARQHVGKRPDASARTDVAALTQAPRVHEVFAHDISFSSAAGRPANSSAVMTMASGR